MSATMSNRDVTKGTVMVNAMVKSLKNLKEDVDLVEFLRMMQSNCFETNSPDNNQTPQLAICQHARITFHGK
jgi:hypothetical protein